MKNCTKELYLEVFGEEAEQLAFAPGRIEFIGNHTDYNGGLVMGAAVKEGITVAVGRRKDRTISLRTEASKRVDISLDNLQPLQGKDVWINYPVGVTDGCRHGYAGWLQYSGYFYPSFWGRYE